MTSGARTALVSSGISLAVVGLLFTQKPPSRAQESTVTAKENPVAASPAVQTPPPQPAEGAGRPQPPGEESAQEKVQELTESAMNAIVLDLMAEFARVEGERIALAIGFTDKPKAELIAFVQKTYQEAIGNSGEETIDTSKRIDGYLQPLTSPEQTERLKALRHQRDETAIEQIAAEAAEHFSSVVMTDEQRAALFKKASELAQRLYEGDWRRSLQLGLALAAPAAPRMEEDFALLEGILTPPQMEAWKAFSGAQKRSNDRVAEEFLAAGIETMGMDRFLAAAEEIAAEFESMAKKLPDELKAAQDKILQDNSAAPADPK